MARNFDMILRNGRIVDGSGNPSYVGDIGIIDGVIERIGPISEEAPETVDARGRVVTPGFIDLHNHCDHNILAFPDVENFIMQGVTTSLGGNCGISMMPLNPEFRELAKDYLSPFLHPGFEHDWKWKNVGDFCEKIKESGTTQNLGFLLGHGTLRIAAKGFDSGPPTPEEMKTMKELLVEGMEEGAFGMSAGLIYSPGSYATTDEISEVASIIREYGGIFTIHIRNESNLMIESIDEAICIAEKSGIALHISHLKAGGRPNWGKVHGALAILEEARGRGLNATCDAYPYNAGMTTITALLPPWVLEGGVDRMIARLADAGDRERMTKDFQDRAAGFENWIKTTGWANIKIGGCPSNRRYEGMSLEEIIGENTSDPFGAFFDWLLEIGCNATMILFSLHEGDVDAVIKHPLSCVVSDGWITSPTAGGKPHPRGYGTFPRFLARYVREKRLLRLEEAVRKITSMPAGIMGLKDRGMLKEGFRADLVVFDPETIRDKATFEDPHRFPEGIDLVVVNGETAVRKGTLTGARPGAILKKK
ncbi:MAG: D-aminoacylase [Thermovirgaceae bacterium]|nr:D-aminoacylase [Thermovirgaceae bacterium]